MVTITIHTYLYDNDSYLFYKKTTSLLSHCVGVVKGIWPVKSLNQAVPGGLYGNLA